MLSGAAAGLYQLPLDGGSSTEIAGSKTSLFDSSWKSAFRFSYISSNAARCELTNVNTVGRREPWG